MIPHRGEEEERGGEIIKEKVGEGRKEAYIKEMGSSGERKRCRGVGEKEGGSRKLQGEMERYAGRKKKKERERGKVEKGAELERKITKQRNVGEERKLQIYQHV